MHELVENDIQILWQYMQLHQSPNKADCLLVIGSRDDRVAKHAAELASRFHYWYVLVSGGVPTNNDMSADSWTVPTDAEHIASVMGGLGYKDPLIMDKLATNMTENAQNSFKLLQEQDKPMPLSIHIVTKNYRERAALAVFESTWPDQDAEFSISSPEISIEEYLKTGQSRDYIVNTMVSDMHKIVSIANKNEDPKFDVSGEARAAYTRLVAAGYTKFLLNN